MLFSELFVRLDLKSRIVDGLIRLVSFTFVNRVINRISLLSITRIRFTDNRITGLIHIPFKQPHPLLIHQCDIFFLGNVELFVLSQFQFFPLCYQFLSV